MKKTVLFSIIALVLSLTVTGVTPSVYAPTGIDSDDPDPNDSSTTSILHRLHVINHILEKVTARLNAINNGFTDPHTIKLLSHIDNHLGKIDTKLQKLAVIDPGPPNDPAIIAELNGIIAHANSIAGTATQMLQSQNDPTVIVKLQGIISTANSIALTAQNMLV